MPVLNKKITSEERKKFLEDGLTEIKKAIVETEMTIKYLDRKLISAKDSQLVQLQNQKSAFQERKKELEEKMEVVLDALSR